MVSQFVFTEGNVRIVTPDQYSSLWWDARRGVPTASEAARIFTSQAKASTQQTQYIYDLIGDLYDPRYGQVEDYQSAAMKNGHVIEPAARAYYEFMQDAKVTQVGFCLSDDGRFGCSPDGLVGDEGGIEIKSPNHATHVEYLDQNRVPPKYVPQVHFSLIVTGRKWWDFMSYASGLPHLVVRTEPNDFTRQLREELDRFWFKFQDVLARIKEMDQPNHDFESYRRAAAHRADEAAAMKLFA